MKTSLLRSFSGLAAASLVVCIVSSLQAQVLVKNRITAPIRSDQMAVVQGSLHPSVAVARDEGQLPGDYAIHGMTLVFGRSAAQQADLDKLLVQQQTRGTSLFHQWLKPAQFAARYGVSQGDLQATAAWLRSQGFTIDQIPPSADRIVFSGTAAQVETAFHTEMHRYNLNGAENWANSTELSFPQAIAGMVIGVRNLDTFRPLPTHFRKTILHAVRKPGSTVTHPQYTLQNQNGQYVSFLAPADIQTIYDITPLYNESVTGTGQYIGVMGQSDITAYPNDILNFRALSGLSTSNLPQQIVVPNSCTPASTTCQGALSPTATGSNGGDLNESDLDVEWAGSVAKDATILYVTVGNNQNYSVLNALEYAIQTPLLNNGQNVIPVLSLSYGGCEQGWSQSDIAAIVQDEQQANSQGQTVIVSSGDDGSADCDGTITVNGQQTTEMAATLGLAVDFPGSSPYSTSAGGTSFVADRNGNLAQYWNTNGNYTTATGATNGSALSYVPEGAWNDSPNASMASSNGGLGAGGGGVSEIFNASPNYSVSAPPQAPKLPSSLGYLAGKPSWQAGPSVPNDGARDVPDVSLAADPDWDGYVVCTEETDAKNNLTGTSSCQSPSAVSASGGVPYTDANSSLSSFGGTSVVAPQLAGMITLWNQATGYVITSTNAGGVGNANYLFYQLAQTSPSAFHDVVPNTIYPYANSNAVVCQSGTPSCIPDPTTSGNYVMSGYSVGPGYDLATGLGSVDVSAMAAVWGSASASGNGFSATGAPAPDFQIVANPAQVSLSRGSSTNVMINVAALSGFTGTVSLTCQGPSKDPGVTCSLSPATVTLGTSGSATLTISASSSASLQRLRIFPGKSSSSGPWQALAGGGTAFAALFLLGLPAQRRRFLSRFGKQAQWMTLATLLLVVCVGATIGCNQGLIGQGAPGGPGGTTPPTTPPPAGPAPNISNVVFVTATSGSGASATTHSIAIAYNLN
jgi:hypothetical protein